MHSVVGKNSGVPPFHDNDWTFNLGGTMLTPPSPIIAGLDMLTIRTRCAPGGGTAETTVDLATGQPCLHYEIGSHIGDYAAVAGAIAGAAICVALGLLTFGRGAVPADRRGAHSRRRCGGRNPRRCDRRFRRLDRR